MAVLILALVFPLSNLSSSGALTTLAYEDGTMRGNEILSTTNAAVQFVLSDFGISGSWAVKQVQVRAGYRWGTGGNEAAAGRLFWLRIWDENLNTLFERQYRYDTFPSSSTGLNTDWRTIDLGSSVTVQAKFYVAVFPSWDPSTGAALFVQYSTYGKISGHSCEVQTAYGNAISRWYNDLNWFIRAVGETSTVAWYTVFFSSRNLRDGVQVTYAINGAEYGPGLSPWTYSRQFAAGTTISFSLKPMSHTSGLTTYSFDHWENNAGQRVASPQTVTGSDTFTAVYVSNARAVVFQPPYEWGDKVASTETAGPSPLKQLTASAFSYPDQGRLHEVVTVAAAYWAGGTAYTISWLEGKWTADRSGKYDIEWIYSFDGASELYRFDPLGMGACRGEVWLRVIVIDMSAQTIPFFEEIGLFSVTNPTHGDLDKLLAEKIGLAMSKAAANVAQIYAAQLGTKLGSTVASKILGLPLVNAIFLGYSLWQFAHPVKETFQKSDTIRRTVELQNGHEYRWLFEVHTMGVAASVGAASSGTYSRATGNLAKVTVSESIVQNGPPDTKLTRYPSGLTLERSHTFEWSGQDDRTPKESLLFSFWLNPFEAGWSSWSTQTSKQYYSLPDGDYVFLVRAKDSEGESDQTPAKAYFSVRSAPCTITVDTSPSGLDNPQGGGTYTQGTTITISVGEVNGYAFQRWQRDGADFVTQRSFQYSVDASHTFAAIFEPSQIPRILYARTFSGEGSVDPSCPDGCQRQVGSQVSVAANPSPGWSFSGWMVYGAKCSADGSMSPCTFTMPDNDVIVLATFNPFAFSINTPSSQSTSQGGSATFSFTVTTTSGTTQSITLSLLNPPPGIGTPSWTQNPVTPSTSGTNVQLTITTSCSTPAQSYDNLQISGSGGAASTQSNTFSLAVSPSSSCQGTLSVAPLTPPSPSNGATVPSSPATFHVLVSSGAVVRDASVLVYVDGSQVCSGNSDTNGYYSCSYALTQIGHTYAWYATASKSGYNLGTSEQWSFTYRPNQPTVNLSPTSGPPETVVAVTGSSFALVDTTCTISSSPSGLISSSQCTVSGGTVHGSFTVAPGANDVYSVVVTGNPAGDAGNAPFTTSGAPTVVLSPSFGPTGTMLVVTGSGWHPSDGSVTFRLVSSPNNGALWNQPDPVCSVSGGMIAPGCSFQVKPDAWGGLYAIMATGNTGDSTTGQFVVESTFILAPSSGPPRISGVLSGSGYTANVEDCSGGILQSPPLFSALTCQITGTGVLSGTFTVSAGASSGAYVITMAGPFVQQGSVSATFAVTPGGGILSGKVQGFDVFGNLVPLGGAVVEATGQQTFTTRTDVDGRFVLTLPVGSYIVTASAEGYLPESTSVYVGEGFTASIDFVLSPYVVTSVSTTTTTSSVPLSTSTFGYLSVNFDKGIYIPGDSVIITGNAYSPYCTWTYTGSGGLGVAISIYGPGERWILTDTTDPSVAGYKSYGYNYVLPIIAESGVYTAAVSYDVCGQTVYGFGTFQVAGAATTSTVFSTTYVGTVVIPTSHTTSVAFTSPVTTTTVYTTPQLAVVVQISSNSTISGFQFDSARRLFSFTTSGPEGTVGFTHVILARSIVDGAPTVSIDDGNTPVTSLTISSNSTHYFLSFTYPQSVHVVVVGGSNTIPEFRHETVVVLSIIVLTFAAIHLRTRKFRKVLCGPKMSVPRCLHTE